MACEEIFLHELRERGFRLTPQREMVLSALHDLDGRATAEQIYRRVQVVSTSVDISTVYRTLDLLQELGLIAAFDPPDSSVSSQRTYELLGVHGLHAHLACRSCGMIVGADLEPVRALVSALESQYGFLVDLDRLSLHGLCRTCREGSSLDSDRPGVRHAEAVGLE